MSGALKIGVVGCGIGQSHIRGYKALPEMFEVRAICDIDRDKAEKIAGEHKIPGIETGFAALCKRDDIDVVDICTPPHLHYSQCLQALAAGKHAICEKPLVGCLKDVDELAIAEKQSGRRLMPIFQYRFGRGIQKLKFLIAEGLAGKAYLATIETAWRRRSDYYAIPWRGKWKSELGGCLLGHAIHAHDGLSYVSGAIKNVFARTTTRVNPIETEDCASASLEMADGSLATLAVTLGSSEEISRSRFCFSGFAAESNLKPYANGTDPWKFVADSPAQQQQIDEAFASFEPLPEGFEGQFFRYHRALSSGAELPVTLGDARAALELITALYFSAQRGQNVALPIGKDHPKYASWLP